MHRISGGRVEGLYLQEDKNGRWEMMVTGAGRLKPGETLKIDGTSQRIRLIERIDATTWSAVPEPAGDTYAILNECGVAPLPPYIKRGRAAEKDAHPESMPGTAADNFDEYPRDVTDLRDLERYQTVYAQRPGAVAAPTAGLHFTPTVMAGMQAKGIEFAYVTLHVGIGTFLPVRAENLADHPMHAERYECSAATAQAINRARQKSRPIVAVGTTTVRTLESCADETGRISAGNGQTRLFIYPPYRFRVVDQMITNFHLPGSTLLAMIYAFADRDHIRRAYQEAIERRYRFFSYGDAMLIA
jgi:S-adenosylmethionine:tRNA ribosyltransferase-isomerase